MTQGINLNSQEVEREEKQVHCLTRLLHKLKGSLTQSKKRARESYVLKCLGSKCEALHRASHKIIFLKTERESETTTSFYKY